MEQQELAPRQEPPEETRETTLHDTSKQAGNHYLIVRGIRYVVPYFQEQHYSVRHKDVGKSIQHVLALALGRESLALETTEAYFGGQIVQGRIQLKRSKQHRDDTGPFTKTYETVLDPNMRTRPNDRLQILQHVHERCTVYRGPLKSLLGDSSNQGYEAIYKPAGLPVINNEGNAHGCVSGLIRPWQFGHRLDLPVAGVLLLGKTKRRAAKLLQALSPDAKRMGQREGLLKAYLTRVEGGSDWSAIVSKYGTSSDDQRIEIRCRLSWDNRAKKALIAADDDEKARTTITIVQRLQYNASYNESIVRVELITGARQQIRAVLASLGWPIVGDINYGSKHASRGVGDISSGETDKSAQELLPQTTETTNSSEISPSDIMHGTGDLRLYADDDSGRLLAMLQREHVDWCDKCRWQTAAAKEGGTTRGAEHLTHAICLLSYHYRIPQLGIDVKVPDNMLPAWTNLK